ncbi:tripartite tricarboxylate transporter TctB family protein [Phytohabitans kaempferiae]|uniref:Tripartite tricarboxylate transporter TctB family protein n=1 Tax=Phytohabitans kaempferiae TaxID=1620943 RepID=A0ABV6MHI6_9ACTN
MNDAPHPDARRSYLRKRIAALGGVWVVAALFLWQAVALPPASRPTPVSAETFPTIVGVAMVIAATGMLVEALWEYRKAQPPPEPPVAVPDEEVVTSGPHGEEIVHSWPRLAIALGATAAYVTLFFPLGYLLSTVIFLGGMGAYFWRRPVGAVVFAVALTAGVGWLFSLLGIYLPAGLVALPF